MITICATPSLTPTLPIPELPARVTIVVRTAISQRESSLAGVGHRL